MRRFFFVGVFAACLWLGALAGTEAEAQSQATNPEQAKKTYTYTVKKGDTLWDISERLYQDPWVWPKVWEWNPHITNPHWIYPGAKLELYYELPRPEQKPVVEAAAPVVEEQPAAPKVEQPPPPPPPSITFREIERVGFITPYRPQGVGVVLGERHQKVLIGRDDEIFVQVRPPATAKLGELYWVFSTSELISHPVSGREVGYLNDVKGVVEVVALGKDHAVARVRKSFVALESGDKLLPYRPRSAKIILRPGREPVEGNIVVAKDQLRIFGGRQLVFIDLGEDQAIQPGHRFLVYREPKASSLLARESALVLTAEPVGQLLVVAVEKETAAAVVTQAKSELIPGERVRLITGD